MKIENYKLKTSKKTKILIGSMVGIMALGGGYLLNRSLGKYQVTESFPIMNGKIQVNSGDISIIAVKLDDKDVTNIPQKGEGIRFDHAECTNGATGNWDSTNWRFLLSGLKQTKTKCTLYFLTGDEPVGGTEIEDKIQDLVNGGFYADQIYYEQEGEDNNIRFIGPDPDNYVTFNGETWRIIGLMENVETKSSGKQKLLKIIKKDSLGTYSWDLSAAGVQGGRGVNEWSQADLMYALKKYGGEITGLSNDKCGNSSCPSWSPLNATAQNMIEEVTWNTGTSETTSWTTLITPSYMYNVERSKNTGKKCTEDEDFCNDTVERQTTWIGKVGLMYPSDYGLATSGGQLKKRKQCLEISMFNWSNSANSYCKSNDWLLDSSTEQWTMIPVPDSLYAYYVFRVDPNGGVYSNTAYDTIAIRPVVYLKSNVKINGGDGTENSPYTLTIN